MRSEISKAVVLIKGRGSKPKYRESLSELSGLSLSAVITQPPIPVGVAAADEDYVGRLLLGFLADLSSGAGHDWTESPDGRGPDGLRLSLDAVGAAKLKQPCEP